ncbi:MAG: hypothetical protein NUV97_00915 [archaeon]|nr:hypothetical protein [archaeon]MCR4323478.1 hypothetical protein [Nanoarchaeota archaeon]
MKTQIISQEKNPFLNREEIVLGITSEITPNVDSIKEAIGKDKDLIVVKRVNSNFGRQTFTANIFVYDSKESKDKVETIPQKVRIKMAKDKKEAEEVAKKEAEAKAAEDAANETKVEEVKDGD